MKTGGGIVVKTALYTVTYSGAFYRGRHLPLEEIIPRVADMGFQGIEIGAKRPVASPMDLDEHRRKQVRQLAGRHGIEIGCVASYSNLTSPVMERREAELIMLREVIRLSHDLGSPVVRVFAAWPGLTERNGQAYYELAKRYGHPDLTSLEEWYLARSAIQEAVRWAEEYGVVLALQNHKPVTNTYEQTLDMVREVNSPWLKASIDAPHLADQSDAGVRKAMLATGDLEVWSHFGGFEEVEGGRVVEDTGEGPIPVNYPAFFRALHEIGYDGFIAYEGCGPALVNHEYMGIEEVDRRVKLALDYMKRHITLAEKAA
jgi:sugar phosphate isomerase/epimerase